MPVKELTSQAITPQAVKDYLIDKAQPLNALSSFQELQVQAARGRGDNLDDRGHTLRQIYDQLASQGLVDSNMVAICDSVFSFAKNTMWVNDTLVYSPWLENVVHRLSVDIGSAIINKEEGAGERASVMLRSLDQHLGQDPAILNHLENVIGGALFYRDNEHGFDPDDLDALYGTFSDNKEHAWIMEQIIRACYDNAINAGSPALTSMMKLMCAQDKTWSDELEKAVYAIGEQLGYSMESGILFQLARKRPAAAQTFSKEFDLFANAIMDDSIDRHLVSAHIGSREDMDFISKKLNLNISYCFDRRRFAPNGRAAALHQAFEM